VQRTFENITAFDEKQFGFSHNRTWASMSGALQGHFDPDAVARSFLNSKVPVRVQKCIVALCRLGLAHPRQTMRFADFPEAGLKSVRSIDWDPEVQVRVKATCWYIENGRVILPVLQPRKQALELERLSIYVELVRLAYCQGDWIDAIPQLIDLSGDELEVSARPIATSTLPTVSDKRMSEYVQTFIQAKKLADESRALKPKRPAKTTNEDLFDPERQ
jgi:hypothetical protein